MDIQTEKLIVNAFIADRKKERVLYELSKPDKRWGCVLKLEHYIDTRFCFEIKEKISSCEQVYDILKKRGDEHEKAHDCMAFTAAGGHFFDGMRQFEWIGANGAAGAGTAGFGEI